MSYDVNLSNVLESRPDFFVLTQRAATDNTAFAPATGETGIELGEWVVLQKNGVTGEPEVLRPTNTLTDGTNAVRGAFPVMATQSNPSSDVTDKIVVAMGSGYRAATKFFQPVASPVPNPGGETPNYDVGSYLVAILNGGQGVLTGIEQAHMTAALLVAAVGIVVDHPKGVDGSYNYPGSITDDYIVFQKL